MFLTGNMAVCGGAGGCADVPTSRYAKIGTVPVSALGALAYFAALASPTYAAFAYPLARKLFAFVLALMFLTTLWFFSVQMFILHAFCLLSLFRCAHLFLAGTVMMVSLSDSIEE
jgi:uncharacterized membrane protein